jgi:hypothetical protein
MTRKEQGEKLREHRKELFYYFGSDSQQYSTKTFAKSEFLAKKMRQMWIRSGDISTHKLVIPIKRMRTRDDGLFKLLQQGDIAGVIEGREEFPDIDIVIDKKYTRRLDS